MSNNLCRGASAPACRSDGELLRAPPPSVSNSEVHPFTIRTWTLASFYFGTYSPPPTGPHWLSRRTEASFQTGKRRITHLYRDQSQWPGFIGRVVSASRTTRCTRPRRILIYLHSTHTPGKAWPGTKAARDLTDVGLVTLGFVHIRMGTTGMLASMG